MKNIFKKFFEGLKKLFTTNAAANVFEKALKVSPQVLFIIDMVTSIATVISPPKWDDVLWNAVRAKFPKLWDGTYADMTVEERKLYLLGISTELIRQYFPGLSTTTARLAAQAAYAAKYGSEPDDSVPTIDVSGTLIK